jgi:ABC-type transport system substrate-binding protein
MGVASAPNAGKLNSYPKHGTIVFSDWQFPDTLNPLQTNSDIAHQLDDALLAGLLPVDSEGHLIPDLLTRVPSLRNGDIRGGGKVIVLRLKHRQHWSSGVEITSRDIQFGWQVAMERMSGPLCAGKCDVVSSVQVPDRYTAVLHLKKVWTPFLAEGLPPVFPHSWGALV